MEVPASKSVKLVGRWALGSLFFIEHCSSAELVPSDAVVHWTDSGAILCLRPQEPALTSEAVGWSENGKIVSTTSYGIWQITPGTYVKVVSWQEGAQLEGRTINFIKEKHPEIPTTRLIYEWIDPAWTRTFMIMRRPLGVLMDDVLVYMTDSQVQDVADQVAVHVKTLTQHTSNTVETVDQHGVLDTGLIGFSPYDDFIHSESWKRKQWPRFSKEELETRLKEQSNNTTDIPDSGPEFVLYNPDIGLANLYVDPPIPGQKGRLREITGWDNTAYFPRYWVATCPDPTSPAFTSYDASKYDDRWPHCLRKALMQLGFESIGTWWESYKSIREPLRLERASQEYHDWVTGMREENIRMQALTLAASENPPA